MTIGMCPCGASCVHPTFLSKAGWRFHAAGAKRSRGQEHCRSGPIRYDSTVSRSVVREGNM